ncbi:hypothetical protein G6F22_020980 [Rhizopus arrhizus]|nr:hypothetical protein G6F22_020980 [Rhizopus arrhizus]KAG0906611.1 hypothetical protein G6F31_021777 [Rhizopus arrhizus]
MRTDRTPWANGRTSGSARRTRRAARVAAATSPAGSTAASPTPNPARSHHMAGCARSRNGRPSSPGQ